LPFIINYFNCKATHGTNEKDTFQRVPAFIQAEALLQLKKSNTKDKKIRLKRALILQSYYTWPIAREGPLSKPSTR